MQDLSEPVVKSLKQYLASICGASRFRQRLLRHGSILEDGERLEEHDSAEAVELQHVVLPFCRTSLEDVWELMNAIHRRDVFRVEQILQRPQDPNQNEPERSDHDTENILEDEDLECHYEEHAFELPTFLGAACRTGDSDIVRLLIEARSNVDRSFGNEDAPQTPLGIACTLGHTEIVCLLLEASAFTALRIDGQSLLVVAAEHGHCQVARLLVKAGVLPRELLERMALVRHCPFLEQLLPSPSYPKP
ncbi:RIPK4 [Symbiodinium necroappetens]|uniref:RIPK4 protein n=1 Tax=Symbiodinium necroappetens TaxID=1628268 RepID=A0A812TQD3_9DINO|nr:RIPK4 [Symbiodinium necroappetens]